MPQVNPTDGTTVLDDVVVTGSRTLEGYIVQPPFPADDNGPGPVLPDTPEAPEPPQELDEDCRKLAALNRAVLEAARRVGSDDSESGYLLVRRSDGRIQAVGPLDGEKYYSVDWPTVAPSYGLTDFSNVVGLVHNHPRNRGNPGLDSTRNRFSEADAAVSEYFLSAGVSDDFQQFIVVNNRGWAFGNDARQGDQGQEIVAIHCPGAQLS